MKTIFGIKERVFKKYFKKEFLRKKYWCRLFLSHNGRYANEDVVYSISKEGIIRKVARELAFGWDYNCKYGKDALSHLKSDITSHEKILKRIESDENELLSVIDQLDDVLSKDVKTDGKLSISDGVEGGEISLVKLTN